MKTLNGKTVLLTGAASGIGRALAQALADEGALLFLLDIDASGLDATASDIERYGGTVHTQPCDLTDKDQIDEALNAFKRKWPAGPDILINNAGLCYYGSSTCLPPEEWQRITRVNLLAPIHMTQRLLQGMTERPQAHILNVSSMYGFVASNRSSLYHMTKFGLYGFSLALRSELARSTVGVTVLCPGFVETQLFLSMPEGTQKRKTPSPPRWICATPERVAAKAVRAIYRNRRLVLVTPLAYVAYYFGRLVPSLLDRIYHWGAPRKKR